MKRCVQSVCMACTRAWRCDARLVAKQLPSILRTDCALTANTNCKRLSDVCGFRFRGKHNRKDSSNDPVITRILKISLLSSTLVECTRVDERWDKNWTETQSFFTDLSIQLLRQCQIATVINVKKFVTCSIQRKNNWIIFAVSCRDNGNNSSCKGQKIDTYGANTSAGEEEERLSYPESGATATIVCSPVVKCRYSGSYNIFR